MSVLKFSLLAVFSLVASLFVIHSTGSGSLDPAPVAKQASGCCDAGELSDGAVKMANCSCNGMGCICAFDSCGSGGAEACGCGGEDCDCVSKRCPKFSTVSDCTGFTICNSCGKKHCNRHLCP